MDRLDYGNVHTKMKALVGLRTWMSMMISIVDY